MPKNGHKLGSHGGELELLTVALDEMVAGRYVEAADVLASRMRFLTLGIDTGVWESARELLVYRQHRSGLISENMLDVAHGEALRRMKREKKAAAVNKAAASR